MNNIVVKLSNTQRQRIQTRHKASVERYGYQPQALYWSNRDIQEIRFQQLMGILPSSADLKHQAWSLLDVGCGFADLVGFLQRHEYFPTYAGIDISPQVVLGAKSMNSGLDIQEGELADFDFKVRDFDYVMLSGALNEVVETEIEGTAQQQGEYAKSVIKTMYQICKKGVAFNLLDSRNEWVKSRFDLQSFLPEDIIQFCQAFANDVELVEGYLENDFTIYLRK
ncbi:class I SAM-dependent methyltransferase [Thiomicrorhabdus lithotrophica]|uniref:Class I SAM-dependent methyltransferase n=1 Tax=Thiomicrorhabdus lithotrophica TaxID=2949997 RepID=A0ABY8CG72_9GAMM|nr:class I SAM-dependent methyltransferase [Thiomicrorhabdus lithotrophica]WEJ63496.1 class I SAM-dependent methyltransferase [Thiomicrorhabdus lithotrophica]